jgi:hypothetical protein
VCRQDLSRRKEPQACVTCCGRRRAARLDGCGWRVWLKSVLSCVDLRESWSGKKEECDEQTKRSRNINDAHNSSMYLSYPLPASGFAPTRFPLPVLERPALKSRSVWTNRCPLVFGDRGPATWRRSWKLGAVAGSWKRAGSRKLIYLLFREHPGDEDAEPVKTQHRHRHQHL